MAYIREDDFFCDTKTYLDARAFKAYAKKIRDLIHAAETPLSVGEIHRRLGDDAKREWTADALDSIKDIETRGMLPTPLRAARPQDRRPAHKVRRQIQYPKAEAENADARA